MDDNSVLHLVNAADRLPYESSCELSEKIKRSPKNHDQNLDIPAMRATSDSIEFANPCLKIV